MSDPVPHGYHEVTCKIGGGPPWRTIALFDGDYWLVPGDDRAFYHADWQPSHHCRVTDVGPLVATQGYYPEDPLQPPAAG